MFLELIATIVAGIACAGVALLINIATGRRLPRWIMPVAAGCGMIAVTISNEYTWFDRTAGRLPDDLTIAMKVEEQSWLRPWTQVKPYTKRFVAIDRTSQQTHAARPDERLVDLYFFGRWSPVNKAPVLFDCAGYRSAVLIDGAVFDAEGGIQNADWQDTPQDDPVLTSVCDAKG